MLDCLILRAIIKLIVHGLSSMLMLYDLIY